MSTVARSRGLRYSGTVPPLVALLSVLLVSCGSSGPQDFAPVVRGAPEFAVVAGEGGIALTDGQRFEPVAGLGTFALGNAGPLSVGLDATSAAVMASGRIAIVQLHEPAVVADCADCAGIAATDEFVVTTRKNFRPGEGFDIVLFTHDLTPSRTMPAQRLEERAITSFPAENSESPITLAANPDQVTVGYLSRSGGNRAGPSVIAQYAYDGRLLRSVMVDGILGRSIVSPDGRYLALGVGGSGGACVTVSEPVVVDLESLRVQKLDPAVPEGVAVDPTSLSDPWFLLTDLFWQGDVVAATGEVHAPPASESCDPDPEIWRRGFDPTTGRLDDSGGQTARATRWIGPGCDDVIVIDVPGSLPDAVLVRRSGGTEERLGSYYRLSLGRSAPLNC